MSESRKAISVLIMNTVAFMICFACWMTYSILITYLVKSQVFNWTPAQIGTLVAVPVLTGALLRLPVGTLTDIFGGRIVFTVLMLLAAVPMFLVSQAETYRDFWWAGLGFGISGASFAVGIAYTSVWFPKEKQGTALGIFGAGNAGAAITTLGAPVLLKHLEHWQTLPKIYAAALVITAVIFWFFTYPKKVESGPRKTFSQRLAPLQHVRVWRFGLYYFLVFGAFVALTGWLPVYYLNVYDLDLVMVGILSSFFVLPSGLIRALGGWMSDKWGARAVMYWVLAICFAGSLLLIVPNGELLTKGAQMVNGKFAAAAPQSIPVGMGVAGFTAIVFVIGIAMGIGKAAVYKHIPDYFPAEVGIVGGLVGVIGGLGGYFCPKIFGALLQWTGVWTTCWMFLALLSFVCLVWMHAVIKKMMVAKNPEWARALEELESKKLNFSKVSN